VKKAQDLHEAGTCPDIKWHYIGQLQSNKAAMLVRDVPNLWAIESVGSVKLANKLHAACTTEGKSDLRVFVQVNTSSEPQKGGVPPGDTLTLCEHIQTKCESLHLAGLMTIGEAGASPIPFFRILRELRDEIGASLGSDGKAAEDASSGASASPGGSSSGGGSELELSMGMSGDFEDAI